MDERQLQAEKESKRKKVSIRFVDLDDSQNNSKVLTKKKLLRGKSTSSSTQQPKK